MDSFISAALSEICAQSTNGILLTDLWPTLDQPLTSSGLDLCDGVKASIWKGLLNIPGLQFEAKSKRAKTTSILSSQDPSIQSFQDAEKLTVKIVASQQQRDCFVGLYEGDSGISKPQRRVLECLAVARTNGIAQNQLTKEFGMKANNFFYVLRGLECRGLIVRQSTVVRSKEKDGSAQGEDGLKTTSVVSTNLLHLHRYANHLNSQQKLEITKVDESKDGFSGDGIKDDDVCVKDFTPVMKAVCDMLDETDEKVLVVADIKKALGNRITQGARSGTRAWRNICKRLKEAHLVEEFNAEVNKKVVSCLRLLQKSDPKLLQPKGVESGTADFDMDQTVMSFDMDQTVMSRRQGKISDQVLELPIENQIYDMIDSEGSKGIAVMDVCKRLGISHKKYYTRLINMFLRRGMHLQAQSFNRTWQYRVWTSRNVANGSPKVDPSCAPSDTTPLARSNFSTVGSDPRYPRFGVTADSTQREQRILKRLREEKCILKIELYRWLESLEKDKTTTMARKTLVRTLNKLQEDGHCKCIQVSIPSVSNCGRTYRTTEVVLDKSLESLPPELVGQLSERFRYFDNKSGRHGIARAKNEKEVHVLANIKRTSNHGRSDNQAVKAEALRLNGFIFAKMVRAKLLHNFLWKYVSSSPGWEDVLSSCRNGHDLKNPHSTCKLFALDEAIKAMPVELFLQVAGSTQKFEYLLESCKRDLCVADLPSEEYKSLMTTQATGRLSWVIDILRRLKLIRLVTDRHLQDVDKKSHAIITHALELKPYIEQPLSIVSMSLGLGAVDLRPRMRHDFVLLRKESVDIYWMALEYSYATADPRAAVLAFPGSSVPEAFVSRSWTSVRVMSADQRAGLLRVIASDESSRRISLADCIKISRDLNLTVEQVLRVSNDKRQSHRSKLGKYLKSTEQEFEPQKNNCVSGCQRRKSSLRTRSSKRVKSGASGRALGTEQNGTFSDNDRQNTENRQANTAEEIALEDNGEDDYEFIRQCASSRKKSTRQQKFIWAETSEKQLLVEYVRHRATLGARFHHTDWASLSNLPASLDACKRRMSQLNSIRMVRTAVMRLCDLLGERYAKHLDESQQKVLLTPSVTEQSVESNMGGKKWDDFDDPDVKRALDEVIRCKQVAKMETSSRGGLGTEKKWPDDHLDAHGCLEEPELTSQFSGKRKRKCSTRHCLPRKFLKLLNEGKSINTEAYESLAVSNAVELLKLVFLSTSSVVEVPKLLADILRRYSEHDLFAAYNYLREKTFMVGGTGSQPLVLSQQFLRGISSSPFPTNTGNRAANFVKWVQEREKDLMEDAVYLNSDIECGEVFHVLALVSSGELCISPCLPEEGIGEPEESRSLKRKAEEEGSDTEYVKKYKSQDGEVVCRQSKGFPGINISLSRATLSGVDAVDFSRVEKVQASSSVLDANDENRASDVGSYCSLSSTEMTTDVSIWEALASYCKRFLPTSSDKELVGPLNNEFFMKLHSSIRKAGDQGSSLEEISEVMCLQEERMTEFVVDMLEVFGLAVKVNAYKCVHVVDSSFLSKYFLTTADGLKMSQYKVSQKVADNNQSTAETSDSADVHTVTILNVPEEVSHLTHQDKISSNEVVDVCMQVGVSLEGVSESQDGNSGKTHSFRSILPWLNGDGTTNPIVYNGLRRRVLGIVMQNPGVLEDDIISRMDVLNPQSCRKLLELLRLDNHLSVRKMHQTIYSTPPSLFASFSSGSCRKSESVFRQHYFANPLSTELL